MNPHTTPHQGQGSPMRSLRETAGLTVRGLAERVGLHPQSLRNIELGRRPASTEVLERIAAELRSSVADLAPATTHEETPAEHEQPPAQVIEIADFRLYTCEQAAEIIGGGVTANLLRRLATAGVEHTRIGGKVRWTLAQLRAAVAEHAVTGPVTRTRQQDSATSRRVNTGRRSRTTARDEGDLLAAKPGRRYSA
ncbi:helix-turn-helix transcriptional regulator [Nonomuraea sp. K274]|uniref:Helix-turn-helix transcriptional regulator n=1 Tax=Nonomuraea cypriaca TaxID=1187855 RepID=A0A931EXL2_9ACTN|nr:helix-turn-helix transcriptional regulator [Nonomuraea cypriaca]MBF8186365.1 helix-turn-helix transcriptional regulator [Nonomuraea cypriaca]